MVQDIVDMILTNIRVPEERIGDIKAQVGALTVGERRLTELLDRYGADTVEASIAELKRRSEQQMRAYIAGVPDGTYRFSSFIDSDGIVNEPLEIALDMTVAGSDIRFDLSRSSPPCKGPLNGVWGATQWAITSRSSTSSPTCRSIPAASRRCISTSPSAPSWWRNIRVPWPAARPRWRSG